MTFLQKQVYSTCIIYPISHLHIISGETEDRELVLKNEQVLLPKDIARTRCNRVNDWKPGRRVLASY